MSHQHSFGSGFFRKTLWPIFPNEVKRVVSQALLLFLVCFDYSMLRCMKDTVVITASSAAVIPFIKVWMLLPMAILFTFLYVKFSNKFSETVVFPSIISAFLAFFLVFAFVLYPNNESLHLITIPNFLREILPQGLSGLIAMIEYWSFTLFYVIAELWSNIVLSILTWGFINSTTSMKEAPRFYAVLSVASNVAAIAAGLCANLIVSGPLKNNWELSQKYMVLIISISGIVIMFLYNWLQKTVYKNNSSVALGKVNKEKFSLTQSFIEIKNSKHLRYLAIIVVSYFFVINTVEVIWKDQVRLAYPSPAEFNYYMNIVTTLIGIISTVLGVFVATLINKFGWTKTALLTPLVLLLTSSLFFGFIVFGHELVGITSILGTTPLMIAVVLGAFQNCVSKGTKYSIFDATKEMAFVPLSRLSKLRGKAAIDGIISRLGKSGASFALQAMILCFGSLTACTPYIGFFMVLVLINWFGSTKLLGKIIDQSLQQEGILSDEEGSGEKVFAKRPLELATAPK
ncbi:MAG: NTP/NDP exchange transporter [Myxococcales bacterium]|nr:MAG: NTP/NDP exchange transporter [Myxococcales bacterium]